MREMAGIVLAMRPEKYPYARARDPSSGVLPGCVLARQPCLQQRALAEPRISTSWLATLARAPVLWQHD